MIKKNIFLLMLFVVFCSAVIAVAACGTEPLNGKSAYDLYVDSFVEINGSTDGVLTESEWILSLKGEQGLRGEPGTTGSKGETGEQGEKGEKGDAGLSAYEVYKDNTKDDPALSEEDWLESLKGSQGIQGIQGEAGVEGKSAYELYKEAYIKVIGTEDGILGEEEWLGSLKGDTGISISNVEIICGDIIVYFDNDTSKTLENVLPDAGHSWNDGAITTNPTCITSGVKTYTCSDCGNTKKEMLDADNSAHIYGTYQLNSATHWQICNLCGNVLSYEHDYGNREEDLIKEGYVCNDCGYIDLFTNYAYKVNFECGVGVSVRIYYTQDYSVEGLDSLTAYSRDSDTGALLKDGSGQVNFEVVADLGYKFSFGKADISPSIGFNDLKDRGENIYRITKISSDITVRIESEIDALDLPIMVINTVNSDPILDKENYVNCTVSVFNAESEFCFTEAGAGIRGRGNSTWGMPKKPYKLKFKNDIDLFGNGAATKWTLIANYADPSLVRNYLAYVIGSEFENISDITTTVQFVELYLNGSYDGVYLICEQNEVGINRVNIENDFASASTPEDMGFLLELDAHAPGEGVADRDYIVVNGSCYAVKSPDYEDLTNINEFAPYLSYISNYLTNSLNALDTGDFYQVEKYIDVASFVDSYILHELFNVGDVGYSSFYMYKPENDKLYSGPIWDFDISSGNCDYNVSCSSNHLWAASTNVWYNKLAKYEEFKTLVNERLRTKEEVIRNELIELDIFLLNNKNSFLRNFERWDILGTYVWPNTAEIVAITTWEGQVVYLKEWLLNSLDYIVSVYCSDTSE